jgi:hypothetical protein
MIKQWLGGAVTVLIGGVIIFACSSKTAPGRPPDCSSVADTTQPATVSYATQIVPFFDTSKYGCSDQGCHNPQFPGATNYVMGTYAQLFEGGTEAGQVGLCVLKPGDPDSSYIIWKVEGHSGIQGVRMPKTRPPMTASDLQLFRQWVLEGARNN